MFKKARITVVIMLFTSACWLRQPWSTVMGA